MNKNKEIYNIVLSSILLGMAFVLPFLTGQIPEIGSMLCPMHIPVILCGFICGWKYGLLVGVFSPILRSIILGMPPMFPTAFSMSFELGTYGLISGLLYNQLLNKFIKRREILIIITLIISMLIGRSVYGSVMFILMGFGKIQYSIKMFWIGSFVETLPGIIIQILIIPLIVLVYEKYKTSR